MNYSTPATCCVVDFFSLSSLAFIVVVVVVVVVVVGRRASTPSPLESKWRHHFNGVNSIWCCRLGNDNDALWLQLCL